MSFLLMIFLTLVCLFQHYPKPPWSDAPGWSAVLAAAGVVAVGLHAFLVSRRVSWSLARDPSLRDALLARYERWRFFHQAGQLVLFVVVLAGLGWGWAVRSWWCL